MQKYSGRSLQKPEGGNAARVQKLSVRARSGGTATWNASLVNPVIGDRMMRSSLTRDDHGETTLGSWSGPNQFPSRKQHTPAVLF